MGYTVKDHTFMICAYQENPYLEDCISSIMAQTVLGNVKLSTSTPNKYICGLADKYNLPMVVNNGKGDFCDNQNFAYSMAETALVTLCHQDDYYCPEYLENVLSFANRGKQPIIIYTDYFEDRNGEKVKSNKLLKVKRTLNFPLKFSGLWGNKWVRRRILSLGNPICCPSVTFNKAAIENDPFPNTYVGAVDWDAWLKLSSLNGQFIYCREKLVAHRIWEESSTTEAIQSGLKSDEDYKILCSIWPEWIAKIIFGLYAKSQNSNNLEI